MTRTSTPVDPSSMCAAPLSGRPADLLGPSGLQSLRQSLLSAALRRTGNTAAAQDIAQEALTRLLESSTAFTDSAHATGWAVTTAKNLCVAHWRDQGRTVAVQDLEMLLAQSPAADDHVLVRERVSAVLTALNEMPTRQRAVLSAAAELGSVDRAAVSAATGESPTAVRNFLHRGRADLRTRLAASGHPLAVLGALIPVLGRRRPIQAGVAAIALPALALLTWWVSPHLPHSLFDGDAAAGRAHPSANVVPGSARRPVNAPGGSATEVPHALLPTSRRPVLTTPSVAVTSGGIEEASLFDGVPLRITRSNDAICSVEAPGGSSASSGSCAHPGTMYMLTVTAWPKTIPQTGLEQNMASCDQVPDQPVVTCTIVH